MLLRTFSSTRERHGGPRERQYQRNNPMQAIMQRISLATKTSPNIASPFVHSSIDTPPHRQNTVCLTPALLYPFLLSLSPNIRTSRQSNTQLLFHSYMTSSCVSRSRRWRKAKTRRSTSIELDRMLGREISPFLALHHKWQLLVHLHFSIKGIWDACSYHYTLFCDFKQSVS